MRLSARLPTYIAALLLASLAMPANATTMLVNARIHTMDAAQPEATALAWDKDGKLVAVGAREDLDAKYPEAPHIDAGGATVVPGLIDAHGHVLGLGMTLIQADLVGTTSKEEVLARLRAWVASAPADAWIVGRGWDQNDWAEQTFPSAADLDAAFPDRPVYLERIDGHAAWVNSAAMQRAKKSLDGDWQPDGGRIERKDGKATGILVDGAAGLVAQAIPPLTEAQTRAAYKAAFAKAIAAGLTGVDRKSVV